MRRATFALVLGLALASCALPQEPARAGESRQEAEQGDPWILWKWINFAILAGALGYLAAKSVPGLFRARSEEIRKALDEAAASKKDAEARAAGIELRLSRLQTEIDSLRQNARTEMAAEGDRIRRETERYLQRIQEQAMQEIALITRGSREELRRYSAGLAIQLAEQRLRSRIGPDTERQLLDGFLRDLRSRMPAVARTN
jgi:F-type H+-transporting ATPase subunit b